MKLAEVEQKARVQRDAADKAATQKKAAREMAEQAAREKFRQMVIAWMVKEADLDAQELEAMLSVPDVVGELRLNVPGHQSITFDVMQSTRQEDGGLRVRQGRFLVECPDNSSWPIKCYSLGEALIEARALFVSYFETVRCNCGRGQASMPGLHWWGCAVNRPGGSHDPDANP